MLLDRLYLFFLLLVLSLQARLSSVCAVQKDTFLTSRSYGLYIVYHYMRQLCPRWSRLEHEALSSSSATYTAFERLKFNLFSVPNEILIHDLNQAITDPAVAFTPSTDLTFFIEQCDDLIAYFVREHEHHVFHPSHLDDRILRPYQILGITNAMSELVLTERAYAAKLWCLQQHIHCLSTLHSDLFHLLHNRVNDLRQIIDFHIEQSILLEERGEEHMTAFVSGLTTSTVFLSYDRLLQSRLDVVVSSHDGPASLYLASPFLHDDFADYIIAPMQRLCKYPLLTTGITHDDRENNTAQLNTMIRRLNDRRAVADVHANVVTWPPDLHPRSFGGIIKRYSAELSIAETITRHTVWRNCLIHVHENVLIFYKKMDTYRPSTVATPATSMTSEHSIRTVVCRETLELHSSYKIIGQLSYLNIVTVTHQTQGRLLTLMWRGHIDQVYIRMDGVMLEELFDLIQSRLPRKIPVHNAQ